MSIRTFMFCMAVSAFILTGILVAALIFLRG